MGPTKMALAVFCFSVTSNCFAAGFSDLMVCVKDDGTVQGPADGVCKNALPKCADLSSKTLGSVKDLLAMKIYGFWKGKDLDLSQTTLEKPAGSDLPQGICSVVGHNIVYGGQKDLEFDEGRNNQDGYQTSEKEVSTGGVNTYSGKSCGARPMMTKGSGGKANGKRELVINFTGEQGARWSSAMLGAMPWEIRAAAYDLMYQFDMKAMKVVPKPMDQITGGLTDGSLTALAEEGAQTQQEMMYLLGLLPPEARAYCDDPAYSDLVARCLGTAAPLPLNSPALQLCQIVAMNTAIQGGGVSNAIVAQVMASAQKNFTSHFSDLIEGGKLWEVLEAACEKRTRSFLGLNRRKKLAKQASCFHDGDWMRVSKDWNVYDSDGRGKRNRKNQLRVAFQIDTDEPMAIRKMRHYRDDKRDQFTPGKGYKRFGVKNRLRVEGFGLLKRSEGGGEKGRGLHNATIAHGYEGAVEYVIRRRICRQSALNGSSVKCEGIIPDKPAGVKW